MMIEMKAGKGTREGGTEIESKERLFVLLFTL